MYCLLRNTRRKVSLYCGMIFVKLHIFKCIAEYLYFVALFPEIHIVLFVNSITKSFTSPF